MGKSQESWNKKEKEKKKQKKKEDKEKRKVERQANSSSGNLDDMIAYVDENGVITDTPPDPTKRTKVKAESIVLGIPKKEDEPEPDPNRKGKVTFFDTSKGYGFIRDEESQDSIFTHINSHIDSIQEGDRVGFRVEMGQKGPNAVDVKLL